MLLLRCQKTESTKHLLDSFLKYLTFVVQGKRLTKIGGSFVLDTLEDGIDKRNSSV